MSAITVMKLDALFDINTVTNYKDVRENSIIIY